jgi:hypothetical protein
MSNITSAGPPLPKLDPNEWNGTSAIACASIGLILATAAVALRFWARAGILRVVALEDWFILASLVFSVALTACLGLRRFPGCLPFPGTIQHADTQSPELTHGLGKHVMFVSLEDLTIFFELSLALSIVYVLTLMFTKLSILCLYIRVLTYGYVRRAAQVMLGVVLVSHLYILATLFTACIPLSAFWDLTPSRANAYCHPMSIYWSHAGLNIVTDFLIFILPLTVIHKIRTPRPQKIALVVIFLLAFV